MFAIIVTEKGGEQRRLEFETNEVTIGRVQGNDIILPKGNVSKKHSRIVFKDGKYIIVDLKSTNGTYVNGRKISSPLVIKGSDRCYVGDFILHIDDGSEPSEGAAPPPPPPKASGKGTSSKLKASPSSPPPGPKRSKSVADRPASKPRTPDQPAYMMEDDDDDAPAIEPAKKKGSKSVTKRAKLKPAPTIPIPVTDATPPATAEAEAEDIPADATLASQGRALAAPQAVGLARWATAIKEPVADKVRAAVAEIRAAAYAALAEDLQPASMDAAAQTDAAARKGAATKVGAALKGKKFPKGVTAKNVEAAVLDDLFGLGPLSALLADAKVSEIFVHRSDLVFIRSEGSLELHDAYFSSDEALLVVIERLLADACGPVDTGSALIDARLADGTRLHAVLSPLAAQGVCLALRKARQPLATGAELVKQGSLTQPVLDFLGQCVSGRLNILVAADGAGGVSVLNVLCGLIPETERVATVEEWSELQLDRERWIQLESQAADSVAAEWSVGELLRSAQRMRADRVVVSGVGDEAFEVLQAMGAGGILASIGARSTAEALALLESLALLSGAGLSATVKPQIAHSVDLVVQVGHFADGHFGVTQVSEVYLTEDGGLGTADVFALGDDGKLAATGHSPIVGSFLSSRGVELDAKLFKA